MNDVSTEHARPAVLVSDAEREEAVALLRRSFADGRLTQTELEERASAAYAARTSAQLGELTADLPDAQQPPPHPSMSSDERLVCIILLCVHPPAGVAYWLYLRHCRNPSRRSCLSGSRASLMSNVRACHRAERSGRANGDG